MDRSTFVLHLDMGGVEEAVRGERSNGAIPHREEVTDGSDGR